MKMIISMNENELRESLHMFRELDRAFSNCDGEYVEDVIDEVNAAVTNGAAEFPGGGCLIERNDDGTYNTIITIDERAIKYAREYVRAYMDIVGDAISKVINEHSASLKPALDEIIARYDKEFARPVTAILVDIVSPRGDKYGVAKIVDNGYDIFVETVEVRDESWTCQAVHDLADDVIRYIKAGLAKYNFVDPAQITDAMWDQHFDALKKRADEVKAAEK